MAGFLLLMLVFLGVLYLFPAAMANRWQTVYLSAERVARSSSLGRAVGSHSEVLRTFLEAELGSLRNQLLIANSTQLSDHLDERHREQAVEMALHALELDFEDMGMLRSDDELAEARKLYAERFKQSLEAAPTARGAVIKSLASSYDRVEERLRKESKIWLLHPSRIEALELYPNLLRFIYGLGALAVIFYALIRFGLSPLLNVP